MESQEYAKSSSRSIERLNVLPQAPSIREINTANGQNICDELNAIIAQNEQKIVQVPCEPYTEEDEELETDLANHQVEDEFY